MELVIFERMRGSVTKERGNKEETSYLISP